MTNYTIVNRYNMQPYGSEGSDGLASPDDRDEAGTESDLLASANGELKIKKKYFFSSSFFSFSLCIYIYIYAILLRRL